MSSYRIIRWIAAVALAAATCVAQAQDFPSRPLTLVAPYPPGSATDNVARPLALALQEILGQPVIVDNRAGAQGTIGADYVARAKPDGYTVLIASTTMFAGTSLMKSLPYDPIKGFQAVSGIGSTSMMFLVRADSPIKTINDLVEAAKTHGRRKPTRRRCWIFSRGTGTAPRAATRSSSPPTFRCSTCKDRCGTCGSWT